MINQFFCYFIFILLFRIPMVKAEEVIHKKAVKDFFLQAELSKETVYLGEGLDIRYYLYSKIKGIEEKIISYPKLNHFLKRFYNEFNTFELIKINNVDYFRSLKYAAKIFPLRTGEIVVDPMAIEIVYRDENEELTQYNNYQNRKINSILVTGLPLNIKVIPLPSQNIPENFNDLIGPHQFQIKLSRFHFSVNEPINIDLTIRGSGALENLSPPELLNLDKFEKFDVQSSFSFDLDGNAQKTFHYIYLSKSAQKIEKFNLPMYYFLPETHKFESQNLELGPLIIEKGKGGIIRKAASEEEISKIGNLQEQYLNFASGKKKSLGIIGPIYSYKRDDFRFIDKINLLLGIIIFFLIILILIDKFKIRHTRGKKVKILRKDIKEHGLTYEKIYQLLRLLENHHKAGEDISIKEVVRNSPLSDNAKEYFLSLLTLAENISFNQKSQIKEFSYKKKYFSEIQKLIN